MMERAVAAENALSYTDVSMVLNVKTSAIPSAVEVADFTGNMSMPSNFRLKDDLLNSSKDFSKNIDASSLAKVQFSDLEWRTCLYSTDCSETGLVLSQDSGNMLSLKRFSKQKIKLLGKESQVLKEEDLMKSLNPSAFVPQVLCTCADQTHVGILLNTCLACPLASVLHTPLDEPSAQFCAASVIIALQELHKNGILYRGVSPDVLMFDQAGRLQEEVEMEDISGELFTNIDSCDLNDPLTVLGYIEEIYSYYRNTEVNQEPTIIKGIATSSTNRRSEREVKEIQDREKLSAATDDNHSNNSIGSKQHQL